MDKGNAALGTEDNAVHVRLKNPPGDPFTTMGDHRKDQKRKTILFRMNLVALMAQLVAVVVAVVIMISVADKAVENIAKAVNMLSKETSQ